MNTFNWGLPAAASTYAGQIDFGIRLIHWAMVTIFVLWGIFFAYLLVRYRKREGVPAERERDHSVVKSLLPDILVMLFELVLIFTYALPVWSKIKMNMPVEADTHRVDVIAEQFAWNAHYPGLDGKFGRRDPKLVHFSNPIGLDRSDPAAADDIVTANELHMPLGRRTLIRLSSKDVIHSFFVPEFRIKQDAVPGMVIPVWIEPTKEGSFDIACAQLCGFAHSLMRGVAVVDSPQAYKDWAAGSTQAEKKEDKTAEPW